MAEDSLVEKIGNYDLKDKGLKPEDKADDDPLYKGIAEYKESYQDKIKEFEAKYGVPSVSSDARSKNTYFRELFVRFMEQLNESGKSYDGDPQTRAKDPKKAAIEMRDFFGEKGEKLYHLALEEEMNSKEYMDAVYHHSSEAQPGEKWAERPIVLVAGPSASGKTYAAKCAIDEAKRFLKKQEGDNSGNQVVFVDGGIGREVSQMRKLAIRVANNRGYTGIEDLHDQSHALEKVKDRVYDHAAHHTQHGLVIPETFSGFLNPFDKSRKMLSEIMEMPNAKPIFCRVEGKNPATFQKVVAFMGSSRAWKTDQFDEPKPLELNGKTSSESKAYGAAGFRWGVSGSKSAEEWYRSHAKENLVMVITNDLVLKNPKEPNGETSTNPEMWKDAEYGEDKVMMMPERIFNAWKANPGGMTLEDYMKVNKVPPLILTSSEMSVSILEETLMKEINRLADKIHSKSDSDIQNTIRRNDILSAIYNDFYTLNIKDKTSVSNLLDKVNDNLQIISKGKSHEVLKNISEGLQQLQKELLIQTTFDVNIVRASPEKLSPADLSTLLAKSYVKNGEYSEQELTRAKFDACVYLRLHTVFARDNGLIDVMLRAELKLGPEAKVRIQETVKKTASDQAAKVQETLHKEPANDQTFQTRMRR